MSTIQTLIEQYIRCYNQVDIDGMLECVSEDVVFENVSNAGQSMRLEGKEAMRDIANLGMRAFSYRRQNILKLICQDDSAAAEVTFTGVAALDLPNGTKQGETVEIHGVSLFEMRDGQLSRVADFS